MNNTDKLNKEYNLNGTKEDNALLARVVKIQHCMTLLIQGHKFQQ